MDQRRIIKRNDRLAVCRAALGPSSFHLGAAVPTIRKQPNTDPEPSPSSYPPRLLLNDHDHAAVAAASIDTTSITTGVTRPSADQINATLATFAHNPTSEYWWTFVAAARAAAAMISRDGDENGTNNNSGDKNHNKTMKMLLANLTAVVPTLGVDPRGYEATVALLRVLDGLAVRGEGMMTIAPNAIVMQWIISLLMVKNDSGGGPGDDGTMTMTTTTTGATIRTVAVQVLVTLLEKAKKQPEQQKHLAKTLLLNLAFVSGLENILVNPAGENKVYLSELVSVALRCTKLVVVAVGARLSWNQEEEELSKAIQILAKAANDHLALFWTNMPYSHVRLKFIVAALVEVLDAASQHDPVTTAKLVLFIDFNVLMSILQCDKYNEHNRDYYRSVLIQTSVVGFIANITSYDELGGPKYAYLIIHSGFVQCLERLLAEHKNSQRSPCSTYRRRWINGKHPLFTLLEKTLRAMAYIATGTGGQVHALLHSRPTILSAVITHANSTYSTHSCRKLGVKVLVHAMTRAEVGDLADMVRAHALTPIVKFLVQYCDLSSVADHTLAMLALDALKRTILVHAAVAEVKCLRDDRALFDVVDFIQQQYAGELVAQSAEAVKQLLTLAQDPELVHEAPPPPAAADDQAALRLF
jgi:hypothetical protein